MTLTVVTVVGLIALAVLIWVYFRLPISEI